MISIVEAVVGIVASICQAISFLFDLLNIANIFTIKSEYKKASTIEKMVYIVVGIVSILAVCGAIYAFIYL